jgi:Zn-dependent protease
MLTLGHVRGVPIVVSPSWLLIGLLLTLVYGPVLHSAVGDISGSTAYLAAVGFSVLFAACVLAHELGHTLVSTGLGYPVHRVVLFVLGGVSEIDGEPRRARHELFIAAAGPAVSVALAGVGFAGYAVTDPASLVGVLSVLLAWSNVVLAAFNLLPGLPLDGGRILRATVWGFGASSAVSTRVAAWAGRVLAVLVVAAGVWLARGEDALASAVLTTLLGGYLWVSATQSLKVAKLVDALPGVRVDQLLRPGLLVPGNLSVAEALRRVWHSDARGLVLVDAAQRPSAIVDESLIGAVAPERRAWTPVSDVARPLQAGLTVPVGMDAAALLTHMQQNPAREYLVLAEDGTPAGIIATADFAQRLKEKTG